MKESRLISCKNLDDPDDIVIAGSNEEYDLLCDWSRDELVETVQKLDKKLNKFEVAMNKIAMLGMGELAYTPDFTEKVNSIARKILAEK